MDNPWSARPARPPVSKGDYTPTRPYIRPGADHSHLLNHNERSEPMGWYDRRHPDERRQAIIFCLQQGRERTTPQLAGELGVENRKTLSNDLQRLRQEERITARPGFNNTSIWRIAEPAVTDTPERAADATEAEAARDAVPGLAGDTDETPSPEGEEQYALEEERPAAVEPEPDFDAGQEREAPAIQGGRTPVVGNTADSVERIAIASDGCLLVFHSNGQLSEFDPDTAWGIHQLIEKNRGMVMRARNNLGE